MPDNPQKSSHTAMNARRKFKIKVHPCIVTKLDSVQVVNDIIYEIGSSSVNSNTYLFVENPGCGYT